MRGVGSPSHSASDERKEGVLVAVKPLETIGLKDMVYAPVFSISDSGDICFCGCNEDQHKEKNCTLFIIKSSGKILKTILSGIPVCGNFHMHSCCTPETPQISNDCVHLALHINSYSHEEEGHYVKTNLQGNVIWKWEIAGRLVQSVITSMGGQYIFYVSHQNSANSKYAGTLTFLSKDGEEFWTIKERWLNNACSFYLLPNDLLVISTSHTDPNLIGLMSELFIVNTTGQIVKRINILELSKEYGVHTGDVWQFPVCPPQRNLIFMPDTWIDFDHSSRTIRYRPQPVILYNPMSEELQSKEFHVAEVKAFLWDEYSQVLYISSEKEGDDVNRINFRSGQVDYFALPLIQNPKPKYTWTGAGVMGNNIHHHCTPVMTERGDVIFCNSATSLLCMTPDWKEKWSMMLPEGACDMKVQGNILYVMIYHEERKESVLHRFILP
jgi:hypothetical protein